MNPGSITARRAAAAPSFFISLISVSVGLVFRSRDEPDPAVPLRHVELDFRSAELAFQLLALAFQPLGEPRELEACHVLAARFPGFDVALKEVALPVGAGPRVLPFYGDGRSLVCPHRRVFRRARVEPGEMTIYSGPPAGVLLRLEPVPALTINVVAPLER